MNDYTAETGNSRNLRRGAHQLLELYRGHWGQLFWAAFWFTVKHSPAWVTPIVIANIINIVTDPEHHNLTQFWLNLIVGSVFIAQNVLTAWLHTRASSGLTRGVEMELRGAMVHKLQRLSIQYHTQAQTGRLLSKIMRAASAPVYPRWLYTAEYFLKLEETIICAQIASKRDGTIKIQ